MSNPHNIIPRPQSSSSQEDSPTPNIAEYIKSIPGWSAEEQLILEENMRHYPTSQNAEFKRLTLLMTNLPNKRLRDVSLRVKYMKAKETNDVSWEMFLQNSFGQQKVELSPSQSIKSPRSTPIHREKEPKRGKRTPVRIKREEEELSLSSNSNQMYSVGSSTFNGREREGNSMSMSSTVTPVPMITGVTHPLPIPSQIPINPIRPSPSNPPITQQQPPQSPYTRPGMFTQRSYPSSTLSKPPAMYQTRDRNYSYDDQSCDQLIYDNERCIEMITNSILQRRIDFGENAAIFNSNVNKLLQITGQMTPNLPLFYFTPSNYNIPQFKKVEIPSEPMRSQSYALDLHFGNLSGRDVSVEGGRRSDMM